MLFAVELKISLLIAGLSRKTAQAAFLNSTGSKPSLRASSSTISTIVPSSA
jgi:hypothetical protein